MPAISLKSFFLNQSGKSAAITGTVTANITGNDIRAGGKTVIITLTGDTWIAAGAASFDLQRQNIINGMDSNGAMALGWDNTVKLLQGVGGVVRTSNTVVTITLDAQPTYLTTSAETVTVTVPGSALTGATQIIGSPTFTINPGFVRRIITNLLTMGAG